MANITTQRIRVDLNTGRTIPVAFVHQNDTARRIEFAVYLNGVPYDLTDCTVKYAYKSPTVNGQYTVIAGNSMASGTVHESIVSFILPIAYTKVSGVGLLTMVITPESGTIRPVNIKLFVQGSADGGDSIANASDFPATLDEIVLDWLEENVEPVIDPTLSISGKAADAQVTGNKIANLKSDVDAMVTRSVNLFDYTDSDMCKRGYWYYSTTIGATVTAESTSNTRYYCAIKVPVRDANKITIGMASSASRLLYWVGAVDEDMKLISYTTVNQSTASYTYNIPDGAVYFLATYNVNTDTYLPTVMVVEGTSFSGYSSYEPPHISDDYIRIQDESIDVEKLSFSEYVRPYNLFDYTNSANCIRGNWYYSTTIGSTVEAYSNDYTDYYCAIKFPTYGASQITFGEYPANYPRPVYWVGAVDENMKLLSYSTLNQSTPISFSVPSGAKYVILSYNLGSTEFDAWLPKLVATSGASITHYASHHEPYWMLNGVRTESIDEDEEEPVTTNQASLNLPESYDLVVGDTFQLFYKGIIKAAKYELFDVVVNCSKGNAYTRFFEITPTTAETLSMVVSLYDYNQNLLDNRTVSLIVHAKATSPSSQKNVLCVGDSLTVGGRWVAEMYRRLTGSGGTPTGDGLSNINFIGTKTTDGAGYEGYGGFTFNAYNTQHVSVDAKTITCTHNKTEAQDQHSIYAASNGSKWKLETIESNTIKIICVSGNASTFPSTGTLTWESGGANHSDIVYTASTNAPGNPFWDSTTSKVDFAAYASNQGVSGIDYVYVLLGWNNAGQTETAFKSDAQTFINNVKASFPNAVIVLLGVELPARDGLGENYGATGTYSKYYNLVEYVFKLDKWYDELAASNSNVYHVSVAGQFDTEYNMITSTRQVNTRNSETETYQSNGVHPAPSGSLQIADAAYRDITKRI